MFEFDIDLPSQIRVSLGTAMLLGLLKEGRMDVQPTTAYLMTYTDGKCLANCSFCPQARESKSRAEMLSRVTWPIFPVSMLMSALDVAIRDGKVKRVCIQALNVPDMFLHLESLVREIKKCQAVCVSVSCQPLNSQNIQCLKNAGVDRIGIALDAATESIFCKVKGKKARSVYRWSQERRLLEDAVTIFGIGRVSTHLIVGLGETEKEMAEVIQWCVDRGVLPALFAFTPVKGTVLEQHVQPNVVSYRRLQLVWYLLVQGMVCLEQIEFDVSGKIVSFGARSEVLRNIVSSGEPFLTSGCAYCNRPFYNENPKGPIYNYPRRLKEKELEEVKKQLDLC